MEKIDKSIIENGMEMLRKQLGEKSVGLYELEEMVFQAFQPIQKAALEKAASSLSSEKTSGCRHCPAPASELNSEGVRKKTPEPFR